MSAATEPHDAAAMIAPIREDPAGAAVLFDVDGTLAPIVDRPEDALVPEPVKSGLGELAGLYGLAGCVSGRSALDARRLVGVDGLTYVGNHGLELLEPDASEPIGPAGAQVDVHIIEKVRDRLDPEALEAAGVRLEDKGAIVALHWRGAADPQRATAYAEAAAKDALELGLRPHRGRMVLELRPDLDVDKGSAIAGLLAERELRACLYAGDDATDIDAFRRLGELRESGGLEVLVRVGVVSAESPAQVAELSDLQIDDPAGVAEVIGLLTG